LLNDLSTDDLLLVYFQIYRIQVTKVIMLQILLPETLIIQILITGDNKTTLLSKRLHSSSLHGSQLLLFLIPNKTLFFNATQAGL
jgi:hypothetical protein